MKKLNLNREALADLGAADLRAVGGAAASGECIQSIVCLTGHYPTIEGSCLCTGPCDYSELC